MAKRALKSRREAVAPAEPVHAEVVHTEAPEPSRGSLPWLLVLLAGSGCAALIYEIVWFQLLARMSRPTRALVPSTSSFEVLAL